MSTETGVRTREPNAEHSAGPPSVQPSDKTAENEVYLKPRALAAMLDVNLSSVYRWADEFPDMPVLRIGSTIRFPKARVLAWLRDHEQGVPRRPRFRKLLPSGPQAPGKTVRRPGDRAPHAQPRAQEQADAG